MPTPSILCLNRLGQRDERGERDELGDVEQRDDYDDCGDLGLQTRWLLLIEVLTFCLLLLYHSELKFIQFILMFVQRSGVHLPHSELH